MFSRTKLAGAIASMALAMTAQAAIVNTGSLSFLLDNPIRSHSHSTIRDLAADDFRTPNAGQRCELREVEAIMFSTTTANASNSFILRVFADAQVNGLGRPAELLRTRVGAESVTSLGPMQNQLGHRFFAFRVKFILPSGIHGLTMTPNTRYWVNVSSALSPRFGDWSMARRNGIEAGVGLSPARANTAYPAGIWTMPTPIRDLAFTTKIEIF